MNALKTRCATDMTESESAHAYEAFWLRQREKWRMEKPPDRPAAQPVIPRRSERRPIMPVRAVIFARMLRRDGMTYRAIASMVGAAEETVWGALHGRGWYGTIAKRD